MPIPIKRKLFLCAVLLAGVIKASAAFGLDEVYSPNVEYGELSVEANASQSFDSNPVKNGAQTGELTLEVGIAPRISLSVSGEYSADPGESLELVAHEVQGRFQFFEPGEHWLDAGLLVLYDASTQPDTPDTFGARLLLQKDIGRFTHTVNVGFTQDTGKNAAPGAEPEYTFLWSTRYRYSQEFQPGIEIQSSLGPAGQLGYYNQQEHYIGPSASGKLGRHLKYQVAYLFGASDAAASSAARIQLEYETNF